MITSDPKNRCTLTTALLLTAVLSTLSQVAQADVSAWVELRSADGHLEIDSKIAGIPGYSILDTGAQVNGINSSFLTANNLSFGKDAAMRISGLYGTEKRPTYASIPVEIMGANIDFKQLVDLDFGPSELQLLLGETFLEQYIFQLDYPKERLRFMTRDSVNLQASKNVQTRLDHNSGYPVVKVRMGGTVAAGKKQGKQTFKEVWLLLDTGYTGGVLLERSIAARAGWLNGRQTKTRGGSGVTSSGELEQFNIDSLEIAGYELGNPLLEVPLKNQKIELFKKEKTTGSHLRRGKRVWNGILGNDVLKHFVMTIDYRSGNVHLESGGE